MHICQLKDFDKYIKAYKAEPGNMKSICITAFLFIVVLFGLSCQKELPNDSIPNVLNDSIPNVPNDEWTWEFLGKPLGDSEVNTITIHPENDKLWFVTSWKGIYVTRDGGQSWKNYLSGFSQALEIVPNDPSEIFVSSGSDIYLSKDYGETWSIMYTFPKHIGSILVSKIDNSVYVGLRWEDSQIANGIYKSSDMGETWKYYSFNVPAKGLIPWDIEEDPVNKKIYIATEIYDHPQPYHPPFLRSSDGGLTWQDISGSLPWHAVRIQVQPDTDDVYILTEGSGMYYSKDFGDQWQFLDCPFAIDFIIDKNDPQRFFGGNVVYMQHTGGVFESNDAGKSYKPPIGLVGHTVGSICLDQKSTSLYVASYNSGIYRAK